MERKSFTVILVPHARAKFRKYQVSSLHLWAVVTAIALLTVGSAFVTWTFFSSPVDSHQLTRLQAENEQLRSVNRGFEESIRQLQGQLEEHEERTRQLAIVAGLEDLGSAESGLGGPDVALEGGATVEHLTQQLGELSGQLAAVETKLDERFRWISSVPAISPTGGLLTSGFGVRRDPITGKRAMHQGLDISAPPGKEVRATADGLVVRAGRNGRLGNSVYLSHGFGLTTRYGHLSKVAVEPGTRVRRGEVVGYVGNTGRSTGYHLHYEVRQDGEPVDPLAYILDRGATP